MAKRRYYSVQMLGAADDEWHTLLEFIRVPRNEALGGLRMADSIAPASCYRVIEDGSDDGVCDIVAEGGGNGRMSIGKCRTVREAEDIKHLFGAWQRNNRSKELGRRCYISERCALGGRAFRLSAGQRKGGISGKRRTAHEEWMSIFNEEVSDADGKKAVQ